MTTRIGVDIGGTFTDTVSIDDAGSVRRVKVPSTPDDFVRGLVDGVVRLDQPLSDVSLLSHGTTVGINAIISRAGAKTAVVTTQGHRDILGLRRGHRGEPFNLWWQPPTPIVQRRYCFEVPERVAFDGTVIEPIDEDATRTLAERIGKLGVEAVAIVFLHSMINSDHERRAREIFAEVVPDVYLSVSHEILPEILEYERTATTTVNAYIGPVMSDYVSRLESQLSDRGFGGEVVIATSAGGVATPELVRRVPARTVESGPAAGVMAAQKISALAGFDNVVTFDLGGTSLDFGIIHDGKPRRAAEHEVEWGTPVTFPCIDVTSIGAGGGSIAWIDDGGSLRSGPHSAGAMPGPACYGQGGTLPTNTDAQVLLGRMAAGNRLGGDLEIQADLAAAAVKEHVGGPLGLDVEEAASSINAISRHNMLSSLRLATVERGYDPREFALFALGGAGPLYAAEVAYAGDIPHVVVPRYPGLTSALGLLLVDIRHDMSRSILSTDREITPEALDASFEDVERDVTELLASEGVSTNQMTFSREIDCRYFGQSACLTVPVPLGKIDQAVLDAIIQRFLELVKKEYGYVMPEGVTPIEFVTARVAGEGEADKVTLTKVPVTGRVLEDAVSGRRDVYFDGQWVDTAIYDRDLLEPGMEFSGPAIVEQSDSTTVVPPRMTAVVENYGSIIINTGAGAPKEQ